MSAAAPPTHSASMRSDGTGILEQVWRSDDGGWKAALEVDQTNPFFFDHSLDHIPGMLTICGLGDLARNGVWAPEVRRLRGNVAFRSIGELEHPVVVAWGPLEAGRRTARITQGPTVLAEGWVAASVEDETDTHDAQQPATSRLEHAEARLLHRSRAENIMLGEPHPDQQGRICAAVIPPLPGHQLHGDREERYSAEVLIEAGRQYSTWLLHKFGDWPMGTQGLWIGLDIDIPVQVPRTLPVTLRWRRHPIPPGKVLLTFDLVTGDGEAVIGSLGYTSRGLSASAYARYRESRSNS
ncbi:AfsA-related hotdog domain-containing protein [Streptomyces sp. NPDC093595]|uniref:AfsA-related hotdog domain-containing protein n=1 Tax=Streptomyces sp. NPDC093595 TaxID=3366045 RepID=UPI003807A59F